MTGMITIHCVHCGAAAQVESTTVGQLVQCPQCGEPTPAAVAVPPTPAAPPPFSGPPFSGPPSSGVIGPSEAAAVPAVEALPRGRGERASPPATAATTPAANRSSGSRAERLAQQRRRNRLLALASGIVLLAATLLLLSIR
jgi:hypothetical protein